MRVCSHGGLTAAVDSAVDSLILAALVLELELEVLVLVGERLR
jgi:hypothetical protein